MAARASDTPPYPNLWKGNVWRTAPSLLQTNTAFQSSGKTNYPPGEIAERAWYDWFCYYFHRITIGEKNKQKMQFF
ncbi:hypothetical protein [Bacillus subtilis]|uniref:hypothetical protein n=1 Tax=Bacillus subtilis TaxID=1423 RepID=UPI003D7316BC